MAPSAAESLRQRLKNGETVFGAWNSISSAALVNVIAASGVDFIIVDAEHGPVSFETAEDLVRAAGSEGVPAMLRVPHNDAHLILRALDIGAKGVHVPHVRDVESARAVVRAARYFPEGERGLSPFTKAGKFGLFEGNYTQSANKENLLVVHLESKESMKEIDRIAAVDGVDVVFIGPYDLSQSLGKPGQVRDPEVLEFIRASVPRIKAAGAVCGSFACDKEYLGMLLDCGVQYITYLPDTALIAQAYRDVCQFFKGRKK